MKGLIQLLLSACGVMLILALAVGAESPVSQQAAVEQAASGRTQSQAQYMHEVAGAVQADAARTDAQAGLTDAQARRGLVKVQEVSAEALAGALTTQSEQTAKVIQGQLETNANLANALVIQQAAHDVAERKAAAQRERDTERLIVVGALCLAALLAAWVVWRVTRIQQTLHIQGPAIRVLETNHIGEWIQIEGERQPVFRPFSQPQIDTTKRK